MSTSRILSVVVIVALLVVAAFTLYNAVHTTTLAANTNAFYEQRAGEWKAGSNYAGGNLDQHERGEWFIK